ncbi:hypothetical protein HYC85_028964 [Camellia sinensis]|uniref:Uncharacterized protein n=1 Tax=Camellia sinensis TaxID=4442 RepID=A0A7J7FWM5_CAMSI|nr:hypothetical protein HYC85_028964 [Camellia sinensis]
MRELYPFEIFTSVLEAEPHVRGIAPHVRPVRDSSSKNGILGPFLAISFPLFFSPLPCPKP